MTILALADILGSVLYSAGIVAGKSGKLAPIPLVLVATVLYFFRFIYEEVVTAIPLNGGSYNVLLNTTSKRVAAFGAALGIISYLATGITSCVSAANYLGSVVDGVHIVGTSIGLLFVFAVLNFFGITESSRVALVIFTHHVIVLTVLVVVCFIHAVQNTEIFRENMKSPLPRVMFVGDEINSNAFVAIFLGFGSAMLGITGFETSAQFVEEQKPGVFRKTLRNMWGFVAFYNLALVLLALGVMPMSKIYSSRDFVIAEMGEAASGRWLKVWVAVDAFITLSGSVLTSYVGINGLVRRLACDRVLPAILMTQNQWRKTNHWIIFIFFAVGASLVLILDADTSSIGGVYTYAFLGLMALFSFGCMVLKMKRAEMPRDINAPWWSCIFGFSFVVIAIFANIMGDPKVLMYFAMYLIVFVSIMMGMLERVPILKFILTVLKAVAPSHPSTEKTKQESHEPRLRRSRQREHARRQDPHWCARRPHDRTDAAGHQPDVDRLLLQVPEPHDAQQGHPLRPQERADTQPAHRARLKRRGRGRRGERRVDAAAVREHGRALRLRVPQAAHRLCLRARRLRARGGQVALRGARRAHQHDVHHAAGRQGHPRGLQARRARHHGLTLGTSSPERRVQVGHFTVNGMQNALLASVYTVKSNTPSNPLQRIYSDRLGNRVRREAASSSPLGRHSPPDHAAAQPRRAALGPVDLRGPRAPLLRDHEPAQRARERCRARRRQAESGRLQGRAPADRQRRRDLARQAARGQRLPPGHGREELHPRPHVLPGARQHAHHGLHDDLLPLHARRHLLAVHEPNVQLDRQLHEPQREHGRVDGPVAPGVRGRLDGLGRHGRGAQQVGRQAPAPEQRHRRPPRAARGRGRGQLGQHPAHAPARTHQRHQRRDRGRRGRRQEQEGGRAGRRAGRAVAHPHGRAGHGHPAARHEQAREGRLAAQEPGAQGADHRAAHGPLPELLDAARVRRVPAKELARGRVARARAPGGRTPAHVQAARPDPAADHARVLQQGPLSEPRRCVSPLRAVDGRPCAACD